MDGERLYNRMPRYYFFLKNWKVLMNDFVTYNKDRLINPLIL
jgi:hypothetical protein